MSSSEGAANFACLMSASTAVVSVIGGGVAAAGVVSTCLLVIASPSYGVRVWFATPSPHSSARPGLILTTSVNGLHSTKFQTVLIRSHLSLQQRL
jgi:hypothetical protein